MEKTENSGRKYPFSVEEVAKMENCGPRAVQKWAIADGNVRKLGSGKRAPFMFFIEDIERFRLRDRPGNPHFKEK